ncbi:MAG TPA: DDE-type integrase/transposase/recombinase [Dehalococcoidia bacterium]|nr:DDE-type integrase/transposase/recombinase [Dehalococcoidia bacterium]
MKRAIWRVWDRAGKWKEFKLMRVIYEDFRCKVCGSANVVKYGTLRGIQRWWCKDCHHKFADNDALSGMKTPTEQVSSALQLYYEGNSLEAIRRHLEQEHNSHASDSTIYVWIERFTKTATDKAKTYKPNVGVVWVADETVLRIEAKNRWFFDIIDSKTRFLLASHISNNRNKQDVKIPMEKAAAKAGKIPKYVVTDKLAAYLDGIELAFGSDTKHIQSKAFTIVNSTNLIERFHGTLKSRTKIMRGLKKLDTAKLFTEGWLVRYNFFRPNETIGKTPAEKAEVRFPYANWGNVVREPTIAIMKVDVRDKAVVPFEPKVRVSRQSLSLSPRVPS